MNTAAERVNFLEKLTKLIEPLGFNACPETLAAMRKAGESDTISVVFITDTPDISISVALSLVFLDDQRKVRVTGNKVKVIDFENGSVYEKKQRHGFAFFLGEDTSVSVDNPQPWLRHFGMQYESVASMLLAHMIVDSMEKASKRNDH